MHNRSVTVLHPTTGSWQRSFSGFVCVWLAASLSCVKPVAADAQSDVESTLAASVFPAALSRARTQLGSLDDLPRYDLTLELKPLSKSFVLSERVHFVNREKKPLNELALIIYANAQGALRSDGTPSVQLQTGGEACSRGCTLAAEPGGVVRVRLSKPLAPREALDVTLAFVGELPRINTERASFGAQTMESLISLTSGAPPKDFGILAASEDTMSMGGFSAVLAPRHSGKWKTHEGSPIGDLTSDEMAHVSAHIRAPAELSVITSGVTVGARDLPEGVREYEVRAGLVRDFAVMASERMLSTEQRVGEVLVRAHLLPHSQGNMQRTLAAAADALALFQDKFGPYPYRELDVVEAPLVGGVGGVEFSGLVTVAQMLLEPEEQFDLSSLLGGLGGLAGNGALDSLKSLMPDRKEMLDMVVSHEVAHQWWHVLVGSDSRRNPFVDEGLAQWSALYFLEQKRGAEAGKNAEKQLVMSYQTMRMLGEPDAPVNRPAEAFHTTLAYGGIVYGKGPLVYRELRKELGDQVFLSTLAAYTQRYAFGVAPENGFIHMLAQAGQAQRVKTLAQHWLEQTHGDHDLGSLSLGGQSGLGGLDLGGLFGGGNNGQAQGLPDIMRALEQFLGH
jgi:hypothetical protein